MWDSRFDLQGFMRRVSVGFQILHPGIYEVSECGVLDPASRDLGAE